MEQSGFGNPGFQSAAFTKPLMLMNFSYHKNFIFLYDFKVKNLGHPKGQGLIIKTGVAGSPMMQKLIQHFALHALKLWFELRRLKRNLYLKAAKLEST